MASMWVGHTQPASEQCSILAAKHAVYHGGTTLFTRRVRGELGCHLTLTLLDAADCSKICLRLMKPYTVWGQGICRNTSSNTFLHMQCV